MNKMQYKTKSAVIGRKGKRGEDMCSPCFIALFDINNPHESTKFPKKTIEFDKISEIRIEGLNVSYLVPGNDMVINNLESIKLEKKREGIYISGRQLK